ncbi:proton channel OTOP2-like [Xenopus laevis]|uniref:Proton channel OTOP2-like n=1 Tax=Xenopus laevis TaxID=8355 RepID=A0A8J1L8Z8_XENLA|nr:proton channel OTOP2-like [Xenopus laevis]
MPCKIQISKARREKPLNDALTGGLCLFALATLVLDSLTLGYYHELYQCTSVIATSFPIVQAVFTVIQVSLLSFYAKVCIQEQQHLNRFGLMHTLATNILMWMSVVLDESLKQLEEMYDIHKESVSMVPGSGIPTNSCICHADLCQIFSEGAAYLHPFNIEFSLFSSTMLYVIWKNTGKKPCSMKISGHHTRGFHINGAFVGLILGAFAISATFGVMISFGVLAKSPGTVPEALRIYYLFNSVLLSAIFVASLIGVITCRLQKHPFFDDKTKSVVRSLDITLLVGSSCGPLMVSVFSLVAIFFLHIEGNLYALDLCFSLCKTIQILGQNLFITEALYIGPSVSKRDTKEQIFSISQETADEIIDYGVKNLSKKGESRGPFLKPDTSAHNSQLSVDLNKDVPKNLQNGSSMKAASNTRESFKEEVKEPLFSTRRKILQNISILLICYNISVWILYAYGTRPHLVSKIEQSFYGFTLWVIIVKISLPLGIFYRMHSVASLFEAYCNICAAAC